MEQAAKHPQAARRSVFFYGLFRFLAGIYVRLRLNYRFERLPEIHGNYLLLSNHNTDFDMILAAQSSPRHMYFVGSEHIFQHGWPTRLLQWAVSPILRQKGSLASSTVLAVTRALRRGDNVCLFAEGNRSFDGRTCYILPSTGKLAKAGGAALVTYRIENGYLTTPRWAYGVRRGKMFGHAVNVYTKEQLAGMTAEEVNAAIQIDLFEDAYLRQQKEPQHFKGKNLAEGLENALYFCPECERLGRMHSNGDKLICDCGMTAIYDEYGLLSGTVFSNVKEWNDWQRKKLGEYLDDPSYEPIRDKGVELFQIQPDHESRLIYEGDMALEKGMLRFGEYAFPMEELDGVGICGRNRTVLMYAGAHYEFMSKGRLCALKYVNAYEHISGKRVI